MIYTTYFAKIRSLPKNSIIVSICLYPPDWYNGLTLKMLTPNTNNFKEYKKTKDQQIFTNKYLEKLSTISINQILNELSKITGYSIESILFDPNTNVFLTCFEAPSNFCHRHILSKWLNENGVVCKEYYN